jgi:hypothetical protein
LLAPAPRKESNKIFHGITQGELLLVLPTLEYVKCFNDAAERDIVRVKRFFENQKYINRNTENKIFAAVEVVREMAAKNQHDIADIRKYTKPELLSDEEKTKFEIYSTVANREEVENLFWETEKHPIWRGEISPLIEWASAGGSFCMEEYKKYNDKFNTLFYGECDYHDLDLTRRALLTQQLKDYPRIFRGYTNYSFCWEYDDWKKVINDNRDKFKDFLDKLIADSNARNNMIDFFADTEYKYYNFIKHEDFLKYCENKNIQLKGNTILLIKKDRAISCIYEKTIILYLDIKNSYHGSWDIWLWGAGYGCGVAEENRYQKSITVDYFFNGKDYTMQVFHRDETKIKDAAALWNKKLASVPLPALNAGGRYEITGDYDTIKNYVLSLIN